MERGWRREEFCFASSQWCHAAVLLALVLDWMKSTRSTEIVSVQLLGSKARTAHPALKGPSSPRPCPASSPLVSFSQSLSGTTAAAASMRYITKVFIFFLLEHKIPLFGCWDSFVMKPPPKWAECTVRWPQRTSGTTDEWAEWQQTKIQTGWEACRDRWREDTCRQAERQTDEVWTNTPKTHTEVMQTSSWGISCDQFSSDRLCNLLFCQRGFFFCFFLVQSSTKWLRQRFTASHKQCCLAKWCPPTEMSVVLFSQINYCKMSDGFIVEPWRGPGHFHVFSVALTACTCFLLGFLFTGLLVFTATNVYESWN